jgi:hypothetical protein
LALTRLPLVMSLINASISNRRKARPMLERAKHSPTSSRAQIRAKIRSSPTPTKNPNKKGALLDAPLFPR